MAEVRAFIPCVEFADFLRVTLPHNRAMLSEVVVVTNRDDHETVAVAEQYGAHVHRTDAWTRNGAKFNGALAVEEAMDRFGRHGWVMQLSADIVLPAGFASIQPEVGCIYSARRRMLEKWPTEIPDEPRWAALPYPPKKSDTGLSGYMLLWHADDPRLPPPPWQPINWKHIGGSDSEFVARWPLDRQRMLPFDVLHLGVAGGDWCGRVQPFADGSKPAEADERAATLDQTLHRRRKLRREGKYPHAHEKDATMNCAVFTAVIGPTDTLKEPSVVHPSVRYFCATDREIASNVWQPIRVAPTPDPVRAARRFKIMLHEQAGEFDYYLWVDAAFRLDVNPLDFAPMLMRRDVLAFAHPDRKTVAQEGAENARLGHAAAALFDEQIRRQDKAGFPPETTLSTTGFMVRRNSARVRSMNRGWWDAFCAGGHTRDQMSFDCAAWAAGVELGHLRGNYRKNQYAKFFKEHTPCAST